MNRAVSHGPAPCFRSLPRLGTSAATVRRQHRAKGRSQRSEVTTVKGKGWDLHRCSYKERKISLLQIGNQPRPPTGLLEGVCHWVRVSSHQSLCGACETEHISKGKCGLRIGLEIGKFTKCTYITQVFESSHAKHLKVIQSASSGKILL